MPLRVAVAGLGFMGVTHVRGWRQVPHATLAAAVSSRTVHAPISGNLSEESTALDLTGVCLHDNLNQVLSDTSIDAVDLCIPTHEHAAAAVRCLEAGKHVLVEKPMALNAAECQRMMQAAAANHRTLMVGHVLRFWGEYLPLLGAVQSKTHGRLLSLELHRQCAAPAWGGWLHDSTKSGGGVFDLMIHDVDLCIAMLGLPSAYSASGSESYLSSNLHYEGVDSVTVTGGWHRSPAFPFSMGYQARFEQATLQYVFGRPVRLYRSDGGDETLPAQPMDTFPADAFEAELGYFAECALAGAEPTRCRVTDSALAVALTRSLVEATRERGKRISCE